MSQLSSRLKRFYDKAWGHPWPSFEIEISRRELLGAGNEHDLFENEYGASKPDETIAWTYDCFGDMRGPCVVLNMRGPRPNALVALGEYPLLLKALETMAKEGNFNATVTGHPGIGKTTFLLYVLLHRLANELPTAFHAGGNNFVLFQSSGATIELADQQCFFPDQCWALSDGNDLNNGPCAAFSLCELFVIHATSSRDTRMEFRKHMSMQTLYLPLPTVSEIAAIASSRYIAQTGAGDRTAATSPHALDVSAVAPLVRSWGPCTRTIMDILLTPPELREKKVEEIRDAAEDTATKLCGNPALLGTSQVPLSGEGSAIFFLAPHPDRAYGGMRTANRGTVFIPTTTLAEIFTEKLIAAANDDALRLFRILSKHGLMRSAAGWLHELRIHGCLVGRGPALLPISGPNGEKASISPAKKLAAGTLISLKSISGRPPQYWIPSASNFTGIDGLLVDETFVYAFQATIASQHREPSAGLHKVWQNLDSNVRDAREWRVVVCKGPEEEETADNIAAKFRTQLLSLTLGLSRKRVTVWSAGSWSKDLP